MHIWLVCAVFIRSLTMTFVKIGSIKLKNWRLYMGLYWMIIAVQRDDCHQRKCSRLTTCFNVVTRDVWKWTVCFTGNKEAIKATDYTCLGRVEEYKYGNELGIAFRGKNPIKYLQNFGMSKTYCKFSISVKFFLQKYIDVYACSCNHFVYVSIIALPFDIKVLVISNTSTAQIHSLFWKYSLGEPWSFLPSGDALVFVDSHTTQRDGYPILTYKDPKLYKVRHL